MSQLKFKPPHLEVSERACTERSEHAGTERSERACTEHNEVERLEVFPSCGDAQPMT
jgi:hypothetical protein